MFYLRRRMGWWRWDGTLYGDTLCTGCFDQDEVGGYVFMLPPLSCDHPEEQDD